ncbi:MAG: hypothetical protein DI533_22405 [Cereibacter sphaeroides]|uniref:Uncharacterized protein n=1 Tax=Cereibacter sphaeroides TaxID=1063 RepID=A0A2W5U8W7_CERSP|nr:MAG: hypothetical protein DI533_22405 [Cereibacter sphaeroides]
MVHALCYCTDTTPRDAESFPHASLTFFNVRAGPIRNVLWLRYLIAIRGYLQTWTRNGEKRGAPIKFIFPGGKIIREIGARIWQRLPRHKVARRDRMAAPLIRTGNTGRVRVRRRDSTGIRVLYCASALVDAVPRGMFVATVSVGVQVVHQEGVLPRRDTRLDVLRDAGRARHPIPVGMAQVAGAERLPRNLAGAGVMLITGHLCMPAP